VVRKQLVYLQQRDLGYNTQQLLYIPLSGELSQNFARLKSELNQSQTYQFITKASTPLTQQWSSTSSISWPGKIPKDKILFERIYIDEHVVNTLKLTLIAGRDLDLQLYPSDSTNVLITEAAQKAMGLRDPLGVTVIDDGREWQIVGVLKDFVFTSPMKKPEPIILFGAKAHWALSIAYIRLNPQKPVAAHIEALNNAWKKVNPDVPFEYQFADVDYKNKFLPIQTTLGITATFSLITIAIACLGLLGLAMFMVENRVREIGIRKAMGGTSFSIVKLLSFTSVKPVLTAIVLFSPLAVWALESWLQNFDYRVELDTSVVIVAGVTVTVISVLTSLTQAWKAVRVNPAKTLRHE